jgi:endonuclease/exonuclease/phosphatase family metal-dependent hydrolase
VTPPAEPHRIVVASYNVHRCVGSDGRRDPARVAAVLCETGARVIGLQEVESTADAAGSAQLEEIARATGLRAVSGATVRRARAWFGNALLTALPILTVRRVDLSVLKREPRGLLDVELDWEGQPLRVLVTHFGLTAAERRVQVMLVLGELHLEHERLTILLGDFNEWLPGGRPLRALRTRFGRDRSPRTFPSWRPLLALDRMWGQPRRALGPVRAHGTRLARLASDHLPIVATVTREG